MSEIEIRKESLDNKIYDTRKTRIIMSERYKSWNIFCNLLNTYYSLFLMLVTILSMGTSQYDNIHILELTILIFTVSLVISTLGLKEKELNFKNDYLGFHRLNDRVSAVDTSNEVEARKLLEKYEEEYNVALSKNDNHPRQDYYNYLVESNRKRLEEKVNNNKFFRIKVWIGYIADNMWRLVLKLILIGLPWLIGDINAFVDGALKII